MKPHFSIAPLTLLALSALTQGCAVDETSDADFLAVEAGGKADDFHAGYCEVFIDRIVPVHGSHASTYLNVWVKTLNDRLDGEITKVAFYGHHLDTGWCGDERCPEVWSAWEVRELDSFVGASDYFEIPLFLSGDYSPMVQWEGAFYVETDKGTRYWTNAADGGNFFLDRNMSDRLDQMRGGYNYTPSPAYAIPTSEFPYLNPDACY